MGTQRVRNMDAGKIGGGMPEMKDTASVEPEQSPTTSSAELSGDVPIPSRKGSMISLVAIAIALALSSVITDSCNSEQPVSISTPSFEKVTLSTTISASVPEPSVTVESSSTASSKSGS